MAATEEPDIPGQSRKDQNSRPAASTSAVFKIAHLPPLLYSSASFVTYRWVSHRDRIIDFTRRFPGRNDDEISNALQIKPRQIVNQVCRALAKAGMIERRPTSSGKLGNYPISSRSPQPVASVTPRVRGAAGTAATGPTSDWFWEGNVTDAVERFLLEQDWSVISKADTRTRERGLDLHATQDDHEIVVEVKGYPSKFYRDPRRIGEHKPTSPTIQAQHWYSHALLKALRLQATYPTAIVAMAFPDFPRYRALFQETVSALERLGIAVLFVAESGTVDATGLRPSAVRSLHG